MPVKQDIIASMIADASNVPVVDSVTRYAATNIALVKYWGKRDCELNLPITSSLSIAIPDKGTTTTLRPNAEKCDQIHHDKQLLLPSSVFAKRISQFLELLRPHTKTFYDIYTENNIPTAAGLASSASGFAALTLALDALHDWNLPKEKLSILARLGSGSACRSLWPGFVEWQAGERSDGMDSYGVPIELSWPELQVGIIQISDQKKQISSRQAMRQCQQTSPYYALWPKQVEKDLLLVRRAIKQKDFTLLGETVERNALAMHALMQTSWPPIQYSLAETLLAIEKVWKLRASGFPIYFTQDAGPNIKILFLHDPKV